MNHGRNRYFQTNLPPQYYHQAPETDWAFVFYDWGSWPGENRENLEKNKNQFGAQFCRNFNPTGFRFIGQIKWSGFERLLKFYCTPERWADLQEIKVIEEEQDEQQAQTDQRSELVTSFSDLPLAELNLGLDLDEDCQLVSWRTKQQPEENNNDHNRNHTHAQQKLWISILKSHLQKSIRRGYVNSTIATINEFLSQGDPTSLFRRLPVIVLEDCYLFRDFPILIWLMCYYSQEQKQGREPRVGTTVLAWLYDLVVGLCGWTPWQDHVNADVDQREQENQNEEFEITEQDLVDLSVEEQSLIYSLWLRISYGGMKCDQLMFSRYVQKWYQVFKINESIKNNTEDQRESWAQSELLRLNRDLWGQELVNCYLQEEYNQEIPAKTFAKYQQLRLISHEELIIPEAFDFHPLPGVIDFILEMIDDKWTEDELKTIIWEEASSLNYRMGGNLGGHSKRADWLEIKPYFYQYGEQCYQSIFEKT